MRSSSNKSVTSFDVAKRAGVSRTAVSRAFTPGARIAKETREMVFDAAQALGYRVNYLARGLSNQRSDLVGVVAADMDNPFRAQQVEQICSVLLQRNFRPILLVSRGEDTNRMIGELLHYAVSGVIVTSDAPPTELCAECTTYGVPIVLIDKGEQIPYVDRVVADHLTAARLAAELLAETAPRRLAVVATPHTSFTGRSRRDAFVAACAKLEIETEVIPVERNDYAHGRAAAVELAAKNINGVFCINDYLACGVVDGLREQGHDVPGEVRVIGHDDIPQASWTAYNLTTFVQPGDVQARVAIDLLASRINETGLPARIVQSEVRLVRRGSA